jgi:hypothetical protein
MGLGSASGMDELYFLGLRLPLLCWMMEDGCELLGVLYKSHVAATKLYYALPHGFEASSPRGY